eukprot:scaffold24550_cov60-Cyclotella_meneghiniana.AAC.6
MAVLTTSKLTADRISAAFSSATLFIVDPSSSSSSSSSAGQQHNTTKAYYRDSSGRARVHIHARLEFDTTSDDNGVGVNSLLNCIHPSPLDVKDNVNSIDVSEQDVGADELSTIGDEDGSSSLCTVDTFFSFDCAAASSSESSNNMWTVERVTILKSEIERTGPRISALLFELGVHVRGNGIKKEGSIEMLEEGELELRATLSQREKQRKETVGMNSSALMKKSGNSALATGLLGLELGGGVLSANTVNTLRAMKLQDPSNVVVHSKNHVTMHYGTKIIQTNPRRIRVTLVPPLKLTVREVCGARAASGSTLVEITVEHSTEWHDENVKVTGIAFHPGQSQLWEEQSDHLGSNIEYQSSQGKSIQGGELSVIDMSRRVRWGFCPGAAPDLPLVLQPYEAFATVIQVDAGEDVRSRAFLSPVSVNASVGTDMLTKEVKNNDENKDRCGERIMVSTDVRWTTSRVAVENSDAFKVDMSLRGGLNTICRVGAPLIISLRVLNLSMESRDLMLLMAKDGEGRKNELQWERPMEGRRLATRLRDDELRATSKSGPLLQRQQDAPEENQTFSTAVVSEVNGYTFGVWGLSGDHDGTTRHHRDHELLAVDAALLLGEVKGQHSIEAELRFVPLREGTLDVPNLKLYDKRGGRWYNCCHTLKIVAAAKE